MPHSIRNESSSKLLDPPCFSNFTGSQSYSELCSRLLRDHVQHSPRRNSTFSLHFALSTTSSVTWLNLCKITKDGYCRCHRHTTRRAVSLRLLKLFLANFSLCPVSPNNMYTNCTRVTCFLRPFYSDLYCWLFLQSDGRCPGPGACRVDRRITCSVVGWWP